MRSLLIVATLLASVVASPVAHAGKPKKKKPKTATFKVEYDGHGAWSRNATYTPPCLTDTSTENATFDWDITWKKVRLDLKTGTGKVLSAPKGKLLVTEDHDAKFRNSCNTGGGDPPDCSATDVKYTGPEKEFAHLGFAVQHPSKNLLIYPNADASLNGDDDLCASFAGDASEHPVIYQTAYREDQPAPTPLTAVGATLPLKDALAHGKHVLFVKDGRANLPGDELDCSGGDADLKCDESQGWSGHITITRIG